MDYFNFSSISNRLYQTSTTPSTASIVTSTAFHCLNDTRKRLLKSGFTGDPTTDKTYLMEVSFLDALSGSPNSEKVKIVEDSGQTIRLSLITENRSVNWDKDVKNIALPFSEEIDVGKTIDWIRTDYKYLVLAQNLTQKAYFSGLMEQCSFILNWKATLSGSTAATTFSQYVVTDGPKSKDDGFTKVTNIYFDEGSPLMTILLGKTEAADKLARYDRIILNDIAWEIVVIDNMESDNILRLALKESFIDKDSDNLSAKIANNEKVAVGELRSLILEDLS